MLNVFSILCYRRSKTGPKESVILDVDILRRRETWMKIDFLTRGHFLQPFVFKLIET